MSKSKKKKIDEFFNESFCIWGWELQSTNTLTSQEGDWSCVGHAKLLLWRRLWDIIEYGLLNTCSLVN